MKMFIIVTVFALCVATAASTPVQCSVGQWSDWSECKPSKVCMSESERSVLTKTFEVEPTTEWDTGRSAMQLLMQIKEQLNNEQAACLAAGECKSAIDARPSEGPVACVDGYAADLECSNIDQLSFVNIADQGYVPVPSDTFPQGNDIWGWTDPLNGDEYSIMGLTGATTFVRVTDPENPVPVGILYTATTARVWRDIKVIGNYAFIVSEASQHGLQVFDLTRLRDKISIETYLADANYTGFGNAHNIVSNEDTNFVYVVGATQSGFPLTCEGGLFVLDVSDPLNPKYAGCFGGDGYVHDAQCVVYHGPDTRYQGREICFCYNEDTFTIVDVEDKENMTLISKTGYPKHAYTHQGWLTEDHTIALMDDELDERNKTEEEQHTKTFVWDIRNLVAPSLKSIYRSSERSIDHNQYVLGDFTYQSNYESGLRILHINSTTYELTQVAYFDVYPLRTTAYDFRGTWSVYPYFPSGNLIVSSRDFGLFVVRPDYEAINSLVAAKTMMAERSRTREVVNGESTCPSLKQRERCDLDITC